MKQDLIYLLEKRAKWTKSFGEDVSQEVLTNTGTPQVVAVTNSCAQKEKDQVFLLFWQKNEHLGSVGPFWR